MLIGTYQHNVDAKGRVFVPAKFRSDLGEHFVVSRGIDGCLFLFPQEEWSRLDTSMRTLSFKEYRTLSRYFFSSATEVEADTQGRICLPQNLRDEAELSGGPAVIIGASNRVELWNPDKWEAAQSGVTEDSVLDLLDKINF